MFPVHTHLKMLADRHRIAAYKKAIFDNVHPGDTVADIGTGTGILTFFALQAGADRVYALESGDIIETARKMAADNGLAEKIEFIQADSREARLPEKVDAIITETFGGLGIDEGVLDILADARRRFLKPGGVILPETLKLWSIPIQFAAGHPFASIEDALDGLKTGRLYELAGHTAFGLRFSDLENCRPAGSPGNLLSVDFPSLPARTFPLEMTSSEMGLTRGVFDGVVVAPELVFSGGTSLSLFDGSRFIASHWELVFFPFRDSLRVDEGEKAVFHLTLTQGNGWVWRHEIISGDDRKISTHLSAFGLPSLKKTIEG